ncbi:MAG: lysine N(6)-hydroxylase/L-ornithine N(5)-oxygenase family protein, partial [Roseibium sp.]|uniref:SidA/IucD/PvdA family monooxygenase n=1 Tax=Roseibium sp. TaxID=1936156 RepID=UPI0026252A12
MTSFTSVGVGFGPSNISLAIALEERGAIGRNSGHVFFDDRREPDWHPGLMYPEATMQISFLKDLITMVNPQSKYTFLNYLSAKGRIHDFINLRSFYPRRTEFEDYVKWCAGELAPFAQFETRVADIRPTDPDNIGRSDLTLTIEASNSGSRQDIRTSSVIVADGGFPAWPLPRARSCFQRVIHSAGTLHHIHDLTPERAGQYVFHIVGSGQSSADTFAYIAGAFPNAKIVLSHRAYAMRPEDDSHFVNELFMPQAVDAFHEMSAEWRQKILKDYWHVTHNGVTIDLLPKLYEMVYYDRANGVNRFQFNRFSEIVDAEEGSDRSVAIMRDMTDGSCFEVAADVTILATGYDRPCVHPLLEGLTDHLLIDGETNSYNIDRNYKVQTEQECGFQVFLQGYGERSHGFSEALLSLMPERAARIA